MTKTIVMDTPTGRVEVPGVIHRLHGADRGGLGDKGWSEVPESGVGDPDDTNVPPEFFEPGEPFASKAAARDKHDASE
jgi:hypothetical protein